MSTCHLTRGILFADCCDTGASVWLGQCKVTLQVALAIGLIYARINRCHGSHVRALPPADAKRSVLSCASNARLEFDQKVNTLIADTIRGDTVLTGPAIAARNSMFGQHSKEKNAAPKFHL